MPEINLTTLYAEMQKEMLQKLNMGAKAFVHPGTKGDNTEARRSMIICIHHVSLLEQMWRMQDLSKQRIHLPDYYRKVQ